MHAVVIDRVQGDIAALAKAAASVLGGTAYDVRASMTVPGGGPAVLVVIGDAQRAEMTKAALEQVGFDAAVVAVREQRPLFDVRGFELGEHDLRVEDRQGNELEVPYAAIDLLIRANAVSTTTTTKTVRERKFNLARSVMSSGLVNTKVEEKKKTTRSTDSDELLFVYYAGGTTPLRMAEKEVVYQGLGSAIQPSRTANFMYTIGEIRRRCPEARFDERLRKRSVQSQMLGRTLSADEYVDFAVALVANSVRATPSLVRS